MPFHNCTKQHNLAFSLELPQFHLELHTGSLSRNAQKKKCSKLQRSPGKNSLQVGCECYVYANYFWIFLRRDHRMHAYRIPVSLWCDGMMQVRDCACECDCDVFVAQSKSCWAIYRTQWPEVATHCGLCSLQSAFYTFIKWKLIADYFIITQNTVGCSCIYSVKKTECFDKTSLLCGPPRCVRDWRVSQGHWKLFFRELRQKRQSCCRSAVFQ